MVMIMRSVARWTIWYGKDLAKCPCLRFTFDRVAQEPNEQLTHLHLNKMAVILQMSFWNAFYEWKVLYPNLNFTEICSEVSNWQQISIASGNGSSPNRHHYLNRCWSSSWMHVCSTRGKWVKQTFSLINFRAIWRIPVCYIQDYVRI